MYGGPAPVAHGYSTSRGIPRLRRAISRWYQDRYDVEIDRNQKPSSLLVRRGLAHLMLATLDHGDTVLVPNQVTHSYLRRGDCRGAGTSVPLVEGVDFFNELERAIRESYPKPKMILGFRRIQPRNAWSWSSSKVVALAKRYDVLVVHDGLCRYRLRWLEAPSIMQVPGARDVAVEFFTLSKATTWRAGVSALWLATKRWSARWHVLKLSRLRHLYAVAGGSDCGAGGRSTVRARHCRTGTNAAVMYWLKGCMKRAGWSKCRRLRCMSGRKSRTICCYGLAGICQSC